MGYGPVQALRGLQFSFEPVSQSSQCFCDFLAPGREVPFAGGELVIRASHFQDNEVLAPYQLGPQVEAEEIADDHVQLTVLTVPPGSTALSSAPSKNSVIRDASASGVASCACNLARAPDIAPVLTGSGAWYARTRPTWNFVLDPAA